MANHPEAFPSHVVVKVASIRCGHKGHFGVVFIAKDVSITFSLAKRVWKGKTKPEQGDLVYLSRIILHGKDNLPRAKYARYALPSEEHEEIRPEECESGGKENQTL